MSWSLFLSDLKAEDFATTVDETVPQGGDGTHDTNNQISLARYIALQIFYSGQLGEPTPESRYSASINGHANPGHIVVPNGANEAISVTVARYLPAVAQTLFVPLNGDAPVVVTTGTAPDTWTQPTTVTSGQVELAARSHVELASAAVVQSEPVHMHIAGVDDIPEDEEPAPETSDSEPEQAPATLEQDAAAGQLAVESDAGTVS